MNNNEKRNVGIFLILYAVGLAGFLLPAIRPLVLPLTPFTLLISFLLPLWTDKSIPLKALLTLALCAIIAFFCEVAGVYTGRIFGVYHYGKTLGLKWLEVPLIIGVNWAALLYFSTRLVASFIRQKGLIVFISAGIMTLYDYIMEPVAVHFDFWHWQQHKIPTQNYLAWFVLSVLLSALFLSSHKPGKHKPAIHVFAIQGIFFILLRLWLQFFKD